MPLPYPDEDEDRDDDDLEGEEGGQEPDLDALESVMTPGIRPGAFERHLGGQWDPSKGFPEGSGYGEQLEGLRNPGVITEEELEEAFRLFDADPHTETRKDLMRLYLAEKKLIQDLNTRLSRDMTVKQRGELNKIKNDSMKSLMGLTEALKIQPKQAKDDADRENVATLSQMYEEFKRAREADPKFKKGPKGDPYGLKALIEERKSKASVDIENE
jgi:hypothetical protein